MKDNAAFFKYDCDDLTEDETRILKECSDKFDKVLVVIVASSVHQFHIVNSYMQKFQKQFEDYANIDIEWIYYINSNFIQKQNLLYVINPTTEAEKEHLWALYIV